ncbi:hypothetical protein C8Q73DRAFT_42900 [Cubamyces lactineus]|nr:hypothetical protein C8Q73DRAFT_42900 [Cubamyces lactineus]
MNCTDVLLYALLAEDVLGGIITTFEVLSTSRTRRLVRIKVTIMQISTTTLWSRLVCYQEVHHTMAYNPRRSFILGS